jgi:lipid II:glycine glycyltransferase (peptidoglycan interpeptide bridge formation enzyme)
MNAAEARVKTELAKEQSIKRQKDWDKQRKEQERAKDLAERKAALPHLPKHLKQVMDKVRDAVRNGKREVWYSETYPLPGMFFLLMDELRRDGYGVEYDEYSDNEGPDIFSLKIRW